MNVVLGVIGFIAVTILSYFTVPSLLSNGYFPMHDDTQVTRVAQMTQSIQDGMFPVRWVKDLGYGYGYPIFNFYAPLAYYVGSTINVLGYDALDATKLMIALGLIFAGMSMYVLAKSLWGVTGGIVSAVFYLYAPYHAVTVYVRGAIAETWAYAFVPLAFYGLWKVYETRKWRYVILGAIGFAGVALSHNLTAMMIAPFYGLLIVILGILTFNATRGWSWLLFPVMGGVALLLSAFYWLPAVSEMRYTNVASQIGGGSQFADHFVCPMQLWESMWGFGGSAPGCMEDGLSLKVGKIHLVISLLALIVGILAIRTDNRRRIAVVFIFFGLLLSLVLMLPVSEPLWQAVAPMAYLQFPWRFLLLASFFSSLLAGSLFFAIEKFNESIHAYRVGSVIVGVILVGTVLFQNMQLFSPQEVIAEDLAKYTDRENVIWEISRISDEYMPKGFAKPERKEDLIESKITSVESIPNIIIQTDTTTELVAIVESGRPVDLLVNIAYFPSWHVYIDDDEVTYEARDDGLLVKMPEGEHTLAAVFEETDVEKLANWLSLAGIGVILLGIIVAWKGKFL